MALRPKRKDNFKRSTSQFLNDVVNGHERDTITVEEIRYIMHERGFGILMAIAALPLCIPVPVPPGYTTLFAIPLFILSVQMIFGKDSPWLPKWLTRRQIRRSTLASTVTKASPALKMVEKLLKPRLMLLDVGHWERFVGIFSFIFAISIAIPLPLTNLPPGWGILIMSLGLLGRDGVVMLVGMIVGMIGIAITIMVLLFGAKAVMAIFSYGTVVTPVSDTIPPVIDPVISE